MINNPRNLFLLAIEDNKIYEYLPTFKQLKNQLSSIDNTMLSFLSLWQSRNVILFWNLKIFQIVPFRVIRITTSILATVNSKDSRNHNKFLSFEMKIHNILMSSFWLRVAHVKDRILCNQHSHKHSSVSNLLANERIYQLIESRRKIPPWS